MGGGDINTTDIHNSQKHITYSIKQLGMKVGIPHTHSLTQSYIQLSHDKTLSANQRSLNVRYISCNHALVS